MQSWDDLVRAVGATRRRQREVDGLLFNEVWNYLDNRRDEEVETLEEVTLPDGRKKGRKLWHSACAFSFCARDGEVVVRARDDAAASDERFAGLLAASERMAELMCIEKERAYRASLQAAQADHRPAPPPPLYPA